MPQEDIRFCPHCGQRTTQTSESSPPYCENCCRYIDSPDTSGSSPSASSLKNQHLNGIRGWLILPAIGAVLTPILLISTIISDLGMPNEYDWVISLYPALGRMNTVELFGSILLLILSGILLFGFFGKLRFAPRLYIWTNVISIVLRIITLLVGASLWAEIPGLAMEALPSAIGSIIAGVIWICYFSRSERVKATFVN